MIKKIIVGVVVLLVVFVVGVVIVAAMMPSDFRIERKTTIQAPPELVFAQVNNFHNWEAWSPWAKLDLKAKVVFEGPESGEGAKFSWDGNSEVGQGSNTIIESKPSELVKIKLDFIKPMEGTSTADFTFKPVDDGTEVTWSMHGDHSLGARIFCVFINMDKMIGGQFDQGLANMKKVAEAEKKE